MFKYNHKISRTANAKAMVGLTMRLTPKSKWATPVEGKVVSAVGINGDTAKVTFDNGKSAYYTWTTSATQVA